jgi:hypothetical protein
MGLITKKDVIRNMTGLVEAEDISEDEHEFHTFNAQQSGLLDDDDDNDDNGQRRSGDS